MSKPDKKAANQKPGKIVLLPVEQIEPSPFQARTAFDETEIAALAVSILQNGLLQPISVRKTGYHKYQLVAGERRLRAAVLAGLETVPCLEAEGDGRASALLALVENLQRKDLHYLEEAEAIAAFLHQTGMTQEAVAAQLGMSPSALANKLRLLRLSPACRALLVEHGLTERHARCLLRLEDEGERLTALRQAAAKHWNVAQTEQYVERRLAALQTAPPAGRRTYIIKDVRLFLNSVDRGLRLIRDAGVDARTEREETEDEIVLTLRIPKQRRKEA